MNKKYFNSYKRLRRAGFLKNKTIPRCLFDDDEKTFDDSVECAMSQMCEKIFA